MYTIHVHILCIMLLVNINYFNKNNVFVVQQEVICLQAVLRVCKTFYSINFWLYYSNFKFFCNFMYIIERLNYISFLLKDFMIGSLVYFVGH